MLLSFAVGSTGVFLLLQIFSNVVRRTGLFIARQLIVAMRHRVLIYHVGNHDLFVCP